jgi:hypothetical protein
MLQIFPQGGVVEMFVDIADDDPIRLAPALLPAVVGVVASRQDKRVGVRSRAAAGHDTRFGGQDVERAVGRSVVVDKKTGNERLVMAKEKLENPRFIPAGRVMVNPQRSSSRPYRRDSGCLAPVPMARKRGREGGNR